MGKVYARIDEKLAAFIGEQKVFFVGSAPLAAAGHVNISPKGLETFRILGPERVAYLDLTGSGAETAAHVRENGRIVFMFCSFEGRPRILRLHARARAVGLDDPEWSELATRFPEHPSARCVIVADLTRIADSCGYGVPLYRFEAERTQLPAWAERKGSDGLPAYREQHNRRSIDGLPALGPPD